MRRSRLLWTLLITGAAFAGSLTPTAAVDSGTDAFQRTWARTDQPVAKHEVARTWMWGPEAFTSAMEEWYAEGQNGARVVQYFDKTRMEISTKPGADPNSIWYVTNGLLAKELVTGRLQLGDDTFEPLSPAGINVAGDADFTGSPTYASFTGMLDDPSLPVGATITHRVHRDGSVTSDPGFPNATVKAAYYVPETSHTVAAPFWEFMKSEGTIYEGGRYAQGRLFENPFFATGLPITEAYWAEVRVLGTLKPVLIQVFERRVLTFTPDIPREWQVEAGNVGRHYYQWRYNAEIPSEPPDATGSFDPMGANFLPTWPVNHGGQTKVSVGNQAPYDLLVQMDGPVSRQFTIPACEDCPVYTSALQVSTCRDDIGWHDVMLPPGNYRVQISWPGTSTSALAGPLTYVPDASYASCYFVIQE